MSSDLEDLTIAVTASRRATELAHLITSRGGTPYVAPTVGIEPSAKIDSEAERFCDTITGGRVDYAVFMTGPGVFALLAGVRALGREKAVIEALAQTQVVARSGKPKDALSKHGIRVDLVPEDATSEGLLDLLRRRDIISRTVIVLSHGSDSSSLSSGLREMGAKVLEFSSYSYSLETDSSGVELLDSMRFKAVLPHRPRVLELIDATIGGGIDAITFTSPPSARNLFAIAADAGRLDELLRALRRVIVVVVGPPTRRAVETAGVTVDAMPSTYKMGPMVKELCDYVRVRGLK